MIQRRPLMLINSTNKGFYRYQSGHAGLLFVLIVPFLFGVFFWGTEGARAIQDKARLSEALEVAALVVATEGSKNTLTQHDRAKAYIQYYFPQSEIESVNVTETNCAAESCGGIPFLEYRVNAKIRQKKWFRSFDKNISYYNVSDENKARKYQSDGFDITFAVNMSTSMLEQSGGCSHPLDCLNYYEHNIDANKTRLVKAKKIIHKITQALEEYNKTSSRPATVAFTGFTWFSNASDSHDQHEALFYDPIWYIDNTNRKEWWHTNGDYRYISRCNPTLGESEHDQCKINGNVKSYADNEVYLTSRGYGENPFGIDNCVPIPTGGYDCGPHISTKTDWNYFNINYAANVLGLAVFDLNTAPGSASNIGRDEENYLRNLRQLGNKYRNSQKGWYYHDITSTDDFDWFNELISGTHDPSNANDAEEILKNGFYVGYGVSTTVGIMRAGRILYKRLLLEKNVANKKQFLIIITDGAENGFGYTKTLDGREVDDPVILRNFVTKSFVDPDHFSDNSGNKVYGTFNGICDYIRKKIDAQTVIIEGINHNVESKILIVGVGGNDGKSVYNHDVFKACVEDEALIFNEESIEDLIRVLKHGESGYISPID
ncbi:TadE/TadG family type IV pilus assembly protein [Vibrio cincinnatiensis]|uniref:TadE/TadG family type IV pilus assembly protein n=1 Tax=Vibrio cincinnatiensis TaxID=675 RepID=UPI001EDDD396|nr:TadE/TadG family type IV pilus assembly protein [Vibrio cincinnatiensis]MCG3733469.1 pilus assembly protein [Vibrio cincinnatiensis]MCG3739909.1 pilus assembly protein [Vibrio cincinnatiensis]